jgi:hypothetical protein
MASMSLIKRTGYRAEGESPYLYFAGLAYIILLYLKPLLVIADLTRMNQYICMLVLGTLGALIGHEFIAHHLRVPRTAIYFFGITISVLLSSLVNGSAFADLRDVAWDLGGLLVSILAYQRLCTLPRYCRGIAWCLAICAGMNAGVGLWGLATGRNLVEDPRSLAIRETATMGYDAARGGSGGIRGENYVGMWNAPLLVGGLIGFYQADAWSMSAVFLACACLGLGSILASASRTSLLVGLMGFFLTMLWAMRQTPSKRLIVRTVVLGILLFATIRVAASMLASNLSPYATKELEARWSVDGVMDDSRIAIYHQYLDLFGDSPIVGLGPGAISNTVGIGRVWRVPHNSFLDIAVEYGLIGLAIYLIPFGMAWRCLWRVLRGVESEDVSFATILFWTMVPTLLFLSNATARLLWVVFGCLLGAVRGRPR